VSKNWLEQGISFIKKQNCVGVEGRIYYVSKEYKPIFSDKTCTNLYGGQFMTGNIAYKKKIIESVGGFDENYSYHEDRDLALRIQKHGKICFNPNMIVTVQQEIFTPKTFIETASHIKNMALLFKNHGDKKYRLWRIVHPWNLAIILFPLLTFFIIFFNRFRAHARWKRLKSDDFKLFPFLYLYALYERIQLWKHSIKERVFLI